MKSLKLSWAFFAFAIFSPLLIVGSAIAGTQTYRCSLEEAIQGYQGPCTDGTCSLKQKRDPFCPRIEGIRMPCLTEVQIQNCTYDDGIEPPPRCPVGQIWGYGPDCWNWGQGKCLPGKEYECKTGQRWVCDKYGPDKQCCHDEKGDCIAYDEGGTVCLSWATVPVCNSCQGDCEEGHYEDIMGKCCDEYEKVKRPYECCYPDPAAGP